MASHNPDVPVATVSPLSPTDVPVVVASAASADAPPAAASAEFSASGSSSVGVDNDPSVDGASHPPADVASDATLTPPAAATAPAGPESNLLNMASPQLHRLDAFTVDVDVPSGAASAPRAPPPVDMPRRPWDEPTARIAAARATPVLCSLPIRYDKRPNYVDNTFPEELEGRIPNVEFVARINELNKVLSRHWTLLHLGPFLLSSSMITAFLMAILMLAFLSGKLPSPLPFGVLSVIAVVVVLAIFFLGGLYRYRPRRAVMFLLREWNARDKARRRIRWRSVWDDRALTRPVLRPIAVPWDIVVDHLPAGGVDITDDEEAAGAGFDGDGDGGGRRHADRQWGWWRGNQLRDGHSAYELEAAGGFGTPAGVVEHDDELPVYEPAATTAHVSHPEHPAGIRAPPTASAHDVATTALPGSSPGSTAAAADSIHHAHHPPGYDDLEDGAQAAPSAAVAPGYIRSS
ncbi:hypothetical protein HK405_005677 [Cladochytrium tenue]|nr:hypothetical protein HK405_005677 [Cladochytrium tenue]